VTACGLYEVRAAGRGRQGESDIDGELGVRIVSIADQSDFNMPVYEYHAKPVVVARVLQRMSDPDKTTARPVEARSTV
jgi:hypothetical protein